MIGSQIAYKGQLKIISKASNQTTYPEEIFYTPPFKLTNHFRLNNGGIEYMLMSASAGIMAGDDLNIQIKVGAESKLLLSSQSYEKIHKMENGLARRVTQIQIASGGYLCYNQLPTIPFADSTFINQTSIQLEDLSSRLIFSEILACGRSARNEKFEYSLYHGLLDIYWQKKIIYRDNCYLNPAEMNLSGFGFYEGYSHMGMMIIYGFTKDTLAIVESIIQESGIDSGITQLLNNGYLIRGFANDAEILVNLFILITKQIDSQDATLNIKEKSNA